MELNLEVTYDQFKQLEQSTYGWEKMRRSLPMRYMKHKRMLVKKNLGKREVVEFHYQYYNDFYSFYETSYPNTKSLARLNRKIWHQRSRSERVRIAEQLQLVAALDKLLPCILKEIFKGAFLTSKSELPKGMINWVIHSNCNRYILHCMLKSCDKQWVHSNFLC